MDQVHVSPLCSWFLSEPYWQRSARSSKWLLSHKEYGKWICKAASYKHREFLISINLSFEASLRQVHMALVLRASWFARLLDIFTSKQKPQRLRLLPWFYLLAISREETGALSSWRVLVTCWDVKASHASSTSLHQHRRFPWAFPSVEHSYCSFLLHLNL